MAMDECYSTQLIDGNGVFNVQGLESFMKAVRLADCGLSYVVVSIMGPQGSGECIIELCIVVDYPFRFSFQFGVFTVCC